MDKNFPPIGVVDLSDGRNALQGNGKKWIFDIQKEAIWNCNCEATEMAFAPQ